MPTLDITDDQRDRIERLREELAATHAGEYASVDTEDALRYLLDLADAVEDPDRVADSGAAEGASGAAEGAVGGDGASAPADGAPFDRALARERLEARNRKHGEQSDADEMDLYAIAAAFDVAGRSDMTKDELVRAILDAAERSAVDPFARVDVDLGESTDDAVDPDEDGDSGDETGDEGDEDEVNGDEGSSQLDAMMSLLDTHDDKWREADGDVRYEVDLPDGGVETARTKDDVRALLFRNY
ncbi:hypothetical protein [Halorubrum trueperi]|uniref:Rho termination factor N-terminal domain-containing protein n=1 Tax=Halorubrum trueperi TaxID=2004704 RepID=A0ABD5UMM4_9EURY